MGKKRYAQVLIDFDLDLWHHKEAAQLMGKKWYAQVLIDFDLFIDENDKRLSFFLTLEGESDKHIW